MVARRLAVGLYWMWRKGWDYGQVKKFGSHAGQLGTGRGVQSNTQSLIGRSPRLFAGKFEVVIMIAVAHRRDAWVGLSS